MDDEEDYFGHIPVPLDEAAEDAANDLTFGHIGHIKAGDDASDAAWKPDHASLSSKIEAEKDALLRRRLAAQQPPHNPNHPNYNLEPNHSHVHNQNHPQLPHPEKPAAAWNLLQHTLQRAQPQNVQPALPQQMQQPVQPPVQRPPLQQQIPLRMQHPLLQQLQQPVRPPIHQHLPMSGQLNQLPQHHAAVQARNQAAIQDYQRRLVAHLDQQTRLLLRQHQETAEKQLREAERAQQAGITFDRTEFDRHQEATRQRILLEHHNRLRQTQVHVWQMTQQVMQQSAERPVEQVPALDLRRKVEASPPPGIPMARSPIESNFLAMNPLGEAAINGARPANGIAPTHEAERAETTQRHSIISNARMPRLSDEELEKAPRLQEIERQMAAAGLGPSSGKSSNRDAFGGPLRDVQEEPEAPVKKKSQRRLESMTDRDQELVFRAHLRQIETSVLYKDDYYNSVLKKKQKHGDHEILSDLAERVQSLRLRDKQRSAYGHSMRIRSSKRSSSNAANDENQVASSPPHSDQNTRALANALGTVQSWNPRAPRRVMDFGLLEKSEPVDGLPQKSLREDERVHVRQEVERGYDVIATIHDIARGESQKPLGPSIQALLSTLHLAERQDDEVGREPDSLQSTRFFATMCVIEKGRRYLSHVLELLGASDKVRVMSAIFENLGMLVFASQKSSNVKNMAGGSQLDLFAVMTKIVQDPEILPHDCLVMFDSFSASHVSHRDAFLTTFRSSLGARLIFLCMQRISAGLSKHRIDEEDLPASHIYQFTQAFTGALHDMFEGAESESRVWEVTASLDALASGDSRTKYRAELNRLLRVGAVPLPPSA